MRELPLRGGRPGGRGPVLPLGCTLALSPGERGKEGLQNPRPLSRGEGQGEGLGEDSPGNSAPAIRAWPVGPLASTGQKSRAAKEKLT